MSDEATCTESARVADNKKSREKYAVRHETVIVTGFLQLFSSHFLLPESNLLLELSQFFVHSSLREGDGAKELRELHVGVEGETYTVITIQRYIF